MLRSPRLQNTKAQPRDDKKKKGQEKVKFKPATPSARGFGLQNTEAQPRDDRIGVFLWFLGGKHRRGYYSPLRITKKAPQLLGG